MALSSYLSIRHEKDWKSLDGEHVNWWLHCHVGQCKTGSFNHALEEPLKVGIYTSFLLYLSISYSEIL